MKRNQLREHSAEEVLATAKFLGLCSKSVLIDRRFVKDK